MLVSAILLQLLSSKAMSMEIFRFIYLWNLLTQRFRSILEFMLTFLYNLQNLFWSLIDLATISKATLLFYLLFFMVFDKILQYVKSTSNLRLNFYVFYGILHWNDSLSIPSFTVKIYKFVKGCFLENHMTFAGINDRFVRNSEQKMCYYFKHL